MAERVWTIREALTWTVDYLGRKGAGNPRLSAEWLLSAATGLSRVELYAYHDRPLSAEERGAFREGIERRAAGEPLQYVTGEMPFRHLVLKVRPGVFIPRPETELLVDEALSAVRDIAQPTVVDLCAGSGAVAVSVGYERAEARVYATELAPIAAEVAAENAARVGVGERVTILRGDLFAPLPRDLLGRVDAVVSNPPYIPTGDLPSLPAEVAGFEPGLALDGGPDGLDVARRIAAEAPQWLTEGGALAMELDETRVGAMAEELLEANWHEVRVAADLTGADRIVFGRKPS